MEDALAWLRSRLSRRTVLAGLLAGGFSVTFGGSRSGRAAADDEQPVLGTPEQRDAEKTLLSLAEDPEVRRIQAKLRAELAATPRGRSKAGAATLDHALEQWTYSLIFAEIATHRPTPAILWSTDDTPRTWFGYTLPGVGTSGDNPDAVYRIAVIEGSRRYEVLGRFDVARRPAQVTLELHVGNMAQPPPMEPGKSDLRPVASITDRDLQVAPDGSFRFTVGPNQESPVHLKTVPGQLTLGFRDMLADWTQRPCRMEVRPLDGAPPKPLDPAQLQRAIHADLPPYVRFWARFPDVWFGGLKGNQITDVRERTGALAGFMAGMSFDLQPDQAIVVTTVPARAAYTGFQIMDPWMIAADAKRHQTSLNRSQSAPNPDGSATYVISPTDPGLANWLDTAGLRQGLGILRWQAVPPGANKADLVRDFRVVPLSDVADVRDIPRVTPDQRRAQLAARADGYGNRTR